MTVTRGLLAWTTLVLGAMRGATGAIPSGDEAIVKLVEPIRAAHHLPALGAAVVTSRGLVMGGVTGVRKLGEPTEATIDDQWHLGSDTKAMTATMIAILVERGRLSWDLTIGRAFADVSGEWPETFRRITLTQLLSHRAGLPANLTWGQVARSSRDVREQRMNAVSTAARTSLASAPGTAYLYSNLGYTIAGAMAERAARGGGTLLKPDSYTMIQSPKGGGDYAFGWLAVSRPWARGTALTHAGSNTMNFCVVWIAPALDVAVLAVTNTGASDAAAATDEAVSALIAQRVKRDASAHRILD